MEEREMHDLPRYHIKSAASYTTTAEIAVMRTWINNDAVHDDTLVWLAAIDGGEQINVSFTRADVLDLMRALATILASYDDD